MKRALAAFALAAAQLVAAAPAHAAVTCSTRMHYDRAVRSMKAGFHTDTLKTRAKWRYCTGPLGRYKDIRTFRYSRRVTSGHGTCMLGRLAGYRFNPELVRVYNAPQVMLNCSGTWDAKTVDMTPTEPIYPGHEHCWTVYLTQVWRVARDVHARETVCI